MKKTLRIEGMTCAHCVKHVTAALQDVAGVGAVSVDLGARKAVVECGAEASEDAMKAAVAEAGYTVTEISAG